MSSREKDRANGLEGVSYRELRLLEEVDSTPEMSQRHLSHQLGVALGVTNLLLRNLVKKGYVHSSQVAWRRWVYVLTPTGITRKVHLTLAYVDRFLDHYRRVREMVTQDIQDLTMTSDSRIAIYGTTELTEIIYLALRDVGITRIDVYGGVDSGRQFLGMPVQPLDEVEPQDYAKVMIAYPKNLDSRCHELQQCGFLDEQIVTLLQASRVAAKGDVANV